jgi:hypothetical protein
VGCAKFKIKTKTMKIIIFLLSILISFTAQSQCVIDGTTYIGTTKARTFSSCDAIVKSLSDGLVKSHGDSLKTAVAGVDYGSLDFTNWSSTKQYATGNTVLFGNNIYIANTTPTLGNNPGGNAQWTIQIISPVAYTYPAGWINNTQAPTMNYVGRALDKIIDTVSTLKGGTSTQVLTKNSSTNYDYSWTTPAGGAFLPLAGGTVKDSSNVISLNTIQRVLYEGNDIRVDWHSNRLQYNFTIAIDWANRYGNDFFGFRSYDWDSRTLKSRASHHWTLDSLSTDSMSIVGYAQVLAIAPVKGTFSATGTASTSFTVTLPSTLATSTYVVSVMPTSLLATTSYYITGRSTTQFTINYITGLTGSVTFEYVVTK